jgi:hypothetical protein
LPDDYFFHKNFNKEDGKVFLEDLLAKEPWNLNLNETHDFIQHSQEKQINGRIDHSFVYQLKNESIGKNSNYRLLLSLKGSNFTKLFNYVEIPESFSLKYDEIHSYNEFIASIAHYFMFGLYYFIFMFGSLIFIFKPNDFNFSKSFLCSFLFSVALLIQHLNQSPLIWMNYQTELNFNIFLTSELVQSIVSFFNNWSYYFVLFLIGEALYRKSFPNHFKLWEFTKLIRTPRFLEEFFVTIFILILFFTHTILLYIICTNYFGWWVPTSIDEDKNTFAHYFPAYSSVVYSMEAAISEECNSILYFNIKFYFVQFHFHFSLIFHKSSKLTENS